MPGTDAAPGDQECRTPHYATDLKDGEWALVAPFIPPPRCVGRPRNGGVREMVNAL